MNGICTVYWNMEHHNKGIPFSYPHNYPTPTNCTGPENSAGVRGARAGKL